MHLAPARVRGERGFTLIELLVAMLAAIIVAGAAGMILVASTHLTSNFDDRVDANQQGRLALERITQALNSSCISPSVTPVLSGSTATSLSFYSAQADSPLITPNEITVALAGSQTAPGALTLTTQPLTGTNNNWTASGIATHFTLASYAIRTVQSGTTLPLFSYYGYASDDTPTTQITPGSSGLTSTQAADVVLVTINLTALPTDDWNAGGRAATFTDSVALRLTPASSAASASNAPCT
jgi:Tfp pilus assembly protein PilW